LVRLIDKGENGKLKQPFIMPLSTAGSACLIDCAAQINTDAAAPPQAPSLPQSPEMRTEQLQCRESGHLWSGKSDQNDVGFAYERKVNYG